MIGRGFKIGVWLVLMSLARLAMASDVLDRIVVLVNQQPILLSDWEEAVRYQALREGRSLESVTQSQQQEVLQNLIDEQLVLQQIRPRGMPSNEETARRMTEFRGEIAGAKPDEGWRSLLARYGLSEDEVKSRLAAQAGILHFVEAQIVPGVRIENRAIFRYYRDTLTPQMGAAGAPVPPLEDVAGKIREILTQKRTDELFQEWLRTARTQNDIRVPAMESTKGNAIGQNDAPKKAAE
ncbi:MAG TPA: SurA N-terminal domain-containing protein [Terriglobales bacterium]|nr:SurA N-terminal domain-containing protein [Terriglobales bacterium]